MRYSKSFELRYFLWKCTGETSTFLPVYTSIYRYIFDMYRNAKNVLTVKIFENSGIIFDIFGQILAIFLIIRTNLVNYRPENVKNVKKNTIDFQHFWHLTVYVENIPEFLTYTGTFWSFGKIFDLFLRKSKASKGRLSFGRLSTVDNFWLSTFDFPEISKISGKRMALGHCNAFRFDKIYLLDTLMEVTLNIVGKMLVVVWQESKLTIWSHPKMLGKKNLYNSSHNDNLLLTANSWFVDS